MASNLTIESPNFEKITKEAGQFTSDAINLLWAALNDTRATERRDFREAQERLEPKVVFLAPSANQDNVDTTGCSVIFFTGASSVNVTGFRAPETGKTRLLFLIVVGSGTITFKHNVTSEAINRLSLATGADYSGTTGKGIVLAYYPGNQWREVARSG